MIHLDTSFLIRGLVRGSSEDQALRRWLRAGEALAMSTVAWTEFLCGPVAAGDLALVTRIVPGRAAYTEQDGPLAAMLFNESGRRRGSLLDCMIAAAAMRAEAALATSNAGDFRRFEPSGLRLAVV